MDLQKIEIVEDDSESGSANRFETGPLQIGDDWPGVFIRGDNALHYANMLRGLETVVEDSEVEAAGVMGAVTELRKLLESCNQMNFNDKD